MLDLSDVNELIKLPYLNQQTVSKTVAFLVRLIHHKFNINKYQGTVWVFFRYIFCNKSNIKHGVENYAISCMVSFPFCIRQKVQIDSECTKSYFIEGFVLNLSILIVKYELCISY